MIHIFNCGPNAPDVPQFTLLDITEFPRVAARGTPAVTAERVYRAFF